MRVRSTETLVALMKQNDMSLGRLARYSGCSKGFVSHLATGRRSTCTPQLGERIAEALGVPVAVLFDVNAADRRTGAVGVRQPVAS